MQFKFTLLLFAVLTLLFVRCQTASPNAKTESLSSFVQTDSLGQPVSDEETTHRSTAYTNEPPILPHFSPKTTPSVFDAQQTTAISAVDMPVDVNLLYKNLSPKAQEFDITSSEINRFECKGGTVILAHKQAFEYEDGTPLPTYASVTLKVTEYVNRADMLLAPLTTATQDGQTLESGGMVYAYAFANSKKCRLKKDSAMRIGFKVEDDERFQLFDGGKNDSELIDWVLSPKPNPISSVVHNKVDKRPQFSYGKLEDYIVKHINHTPEMKKYKGEGFTVCAFVTVDKTGKVVGQRLSGNTEFIHGIGIDSAFLGMIKRMPNWIPAFKKGKPVRSRAMITLDVSGFRDESAMIRLASSENYARLFHATVDEMLASVDDDILTFPVKRLGWINCDRFYTDPRPKAHLMVDAGGQSADIKLIFKKLNAIMPINRLLTKQYQSSEIPLGEPVFVVGVRKVGEQIYFGMQETTVDNKTIALNFSPISDDELKTKLKTLNN